MPHKDRQEHLQYHRDYIQKNRDKIRSRKLQQVHGITQQDYEDLVVAQNGVCAICFKPETATQNRNGVRLMPLAVDHDHETGQIRGLLCGRCNTALGLIGDSCETAFAMIAYLKRTQANA